MRYIAVFASRAVADEWWRAVSTSANTKYSDSIRRVAPQFFIHDNSKADPASYITDSQVASGFFGKVFFTRLPSNVGLSVIPILDLVDHVSGNLFFIRSKVSPNEYWYCPGSSTGNVTPNSKVYVSRTERTRFRVRLIDERKDTTGTIMIGSDEIAITLASTNLSIRVSRSAHLIVSKSPELGLKFSDLQNGFGVVTSFLDNEGHGENVKELLRTDDGEEWVLA
ncbi:uncharacterized protein EDB93DRAFT_439638 [Suillus bovinus]|uniref:uncharacterized protein n=1 Tax=Suillus bovinus TaxID=48563 RepID=UPI001B865BE4|nr:uncharacterized protein EDB93DRAFT_439638 [Suillus bovinus]KAG2159028.1 hypothetical protein EDB93DRAFT_439638 [Suillus bovinus]